MIRTTTRLLGIVLSLWTALAAAQGNLGELLDGKATKMSVEQFKEEVPGRLLTGPTPSGGNLEVLHTASGFIAGTGTPPGQHLGPPSKIQGEWTIDDTGRICTAMQIGGEEGVTLPRRCQYWFKHGDKYFLSDSDSDRHAQVVVRTVKQ